MNKIKKISEEISEKSFKDWSKETISFLEKIAKKLEKRERRSRKLFQMLKEGELKDEDDEEETPKEVFERYVNRLDLKVNSLKGKKILDLGCGQKGGFLKILENEEGINPEDLTGIDTEAKPNCLKSNILKDDFIKNFPEGIYDLVLMFGSISPFSKDSKEIKELILKTLDHLSQKGKIKIFPVHRSIQEGLDDFKKMKEILEEIEKIEVKIKTKEIVVKGINEDGSGKPLKEKEIWTENLLIITKD